MRGYISENLVYDISIRCRLYLGLRYILGDVG